MTDRKILAGPRVRRLRRAQSLTQAAMADMLGISASYLNLVERNQRPITATLMLKLAETFDFDPRELGREPPGGGEDALRRRLADPLFADLEIDRAELTEWIEAAPAAAEAFARAFDRLRGGGPAPDGEDDPAAAVRAEIERWRNHFPDLDAAAEAIADELRLSGSDLHAAIAERLRVRHQLALRILPLDAMPDRLRRLDIHARQLQLSEQLDHAGRTFQAAVQLALIEAKAEIDALVTGAALARPAERLYRRHLAAYFAAALVMPYGRFLRACEATAYDVALLARRFGASEEAVAHRLTTLHRVAARGLPFFMLRVDRAGQVSKRFAGASASPLALATGRCPLWRVAEAFDRADPVVDLVEAEDGSRWFTRSVAVTGQGRGPHGIRARFVVVLGVAAAHAATMVDAVGIDLTGGPATPIGIGCRRCHRRDCPQRAAPPEGRALTINERERGVTPFTFVGD